MDCLQLKEEKIGKYTEGELISTDTIIDIPNGYYEENMFAQHSPTLSLRQATIFNNTDSTILLGITTAHYDFVCTHYTSNFYAITQARDSIRTIALSDILPELSLQEFIQNTPVDSIINRYVPYTKASDKDTILNKTQFLQELYTIRYIMPRVGNNIRATLSVCDYLPNEAINIKEEDWAIISKYFRCIPLYYNRKIKKFMK